jgi:hypothetical protein
VKHTVNAIAAAMLAFASAQTVQAHHSHAMFDHATTVTVSGVVREVSYRNPHVFLWIDVEDDSGATETWSVEMSNIQNMIRRGIGGGTFTVGERVTVTMNPLNNGKPGGNYVSIVDSDGTEYD